MSRLRDRVSRIDNDLSNLQLNTLYVLEKRIAALRDRVTALEYKLAEKCPTCNHVIKEKEK